MFNDLLADSSNTILVARLQRVLPILSSAGYATLEDYQASIYSAVNHILALGNNMQPLTNVKGGTPALIGDLESNITNLNNDAVDTINQLSAVESDTSNLFNLGEASQNSIRQLIREQIYANSSNVYSENFINTNNIQNNTGTIDFISGAMYLPLISEAAQPYSASLGVGSIGTSSSPIANLSDGRIDTNYVWNGTSLELIINFASPIIVNRLYINLDTYDGLVITSLTSSPDGTIYNDILQSLGESNITLDDSSGKYSGSVIIDFPPQYTSVIKIIINNIIGTNTIALRGISFSSRQYANSSQLTSTLIHSPIGLVNFLTDQLIDQNTNIVHQYSYDNVHFNIISSANLNLTQAFWYRALLSKSSAGTSNNGLVDPTNSVNYKLINSTTINLGSNITERTINLSTVTGPITLSETPLLGSLNLSVGSTPLTAYSFTNNIITLASNQSSLSIVYQTTNLNAQIQNEIQNYQTPILREFVFEA